MAHSAYRTLTGFSYVLITPARNEGQYIEMTLRSMLRQTLRPAKWVIVSDGSADGTDELVTKQAARHDWIELVRMPERRERNFAGKVEAFNAGYARVKASEYQVIGNVDADVSFDEADYFEFLISQFAQNDRLGVCGTSYREGREVYPGPFASVEDVVLGACQLFRRECFEAIGGYLPIRSGGIDLIAFLSAREKGWQTRTFSERVCVHHRKVASADHVKACKRLMQMGQKDYLLGSHPLWEIARSVYLMKSSPYILGAALTLGGYLWAMFRRVDRTIPAELMELRRDDQMRRLKVIRQMMLRCVLTK